MKKRLLGLFVAVVFVGSSLRSDAIAPVIPIAAVVAETAAGSAAIDAAATAIVTLVGAAMLYFAVQAQDGSEVRVPAGPNAAQAVPAPSAAATTTQSSSWSYSVTSGCIAGASGSGFVDGSSAFIAYVAAVNGNSTCTGNGDYSYRVCDAALRTMQYSYKGGPWQSCYTPSGVTFSNQASCPGGYAVSGSGCVLSNARQAVADGKQDFQRSGASYSPYADDQKGALEAVQTSGASANDTLKVAGKDAQGQPVQYSFQALSSGGTRVDIQRQKQDAAGASYLENLALELDAAGMVLSAQKTQSAQALQIVPTTGVYQPVVNPAGSIQPSPALQQSQQITFPDDYAREGTLQQANVKLNTLHDAVDLLSVVHRVGRVNASDSVAYRQLGFS